MTQIDPADPTLYSLSNCELARLSRGVALGLLKPPRSVERKSDIAVFVHFQCCSDAHRAKACIS
ncbi:hypothetical protein [Novosphingobium resinovorum]|uniref:hypothetical protein n=1 Tax=Novosphingobium resinovorum TaxID=158500 RepID=UPI002ED2F274|nr:hypothetical protein [Novosphingobium resinovorum]